MASLIDNSTGQPLEQSSKGAAFAARFTRRVMGAVGVDQLRTVAERVQEELFHRDRQRDLFAPDVELPGELLPIQPDHLPNPNLASVLSPSQVRTYMSCPSSWWYKYGLGLPDPTNAARAMGIAVHDALAANFEQKVETHEDLDNEGVVGIYRFAMAEQMDKAVLREKDNIPELRACGEQLVRKYMNEAAPDIEPGAVELKLRGEIGGVEVQGRLDMVETNGRIRDIKTACKKPSAEPDHMYRFQVATYKQLAPGASGLVQLDTLVKTKTPQLIQQPWKVEATDLLSTDTLYPLAQAAMRTGVYLPNRTGMMCSRDNCAYWRRCEDEFGGRVKGGDGE